MSPSRQAAVAAMLGARSMAVVGASARPGSFGARMVLEAQRGSARAHLVNPRYDRIGESACVPSLADLDEPIDVVLLGVPDSAVVLFGSANGLREKIAATATDAGMALCGAGCMGFVNNVLGVRALGYLEPDPLPSGRIAFVTHSGSAFSTLLRAHRGFGFRLAVSSGQELVTDTADYVDYALDDPETGVIALLLETPRAVPRLRRALLRAAEQDVPVVLLTVGGSPPGRAMVAAHSGALAGEHAAWHAFCAATGAVHVSDMAEFTDTLELFSSRRRSRGGGVATVHDSGAERALVADLAHELAVPFADLAEATVATIGDMLDDGLVATNPLDVWGTGADTRNLFGACLLAMADDPGVGVTALAVDLVTEFDGDTAYADAVVDIAATTEAPLAVLASLPSAIDAPTAQRLRDNEIPVLEGLRSGLTALGHFVRWPLPVERQQKAARGARPIPDDPFRLLAAFGIPVVESRTAHSIGVAIAAAEAIGYPLVLKTAGALHKTELGGVILGLADDEELTAAYAVMSRSLGPIVTVQPMVAGGVEVSVGFVRDDAFGPLLVVAAGGTLVELLADRVVACPPVSHAGALALLDRLRIRPLLAGWRGAPAVDTEALADVIVAFSEMAIELGDVLDAVEANPIIATAHGVTAVDVLVQVRRAES
jgi:acyl-CoA synthetase (NDP forming)